MAQFVSLKVVQDDGMHHETTHSYELRLRDGTHVPLGDYATGWVPAFRRALLRENPRIELASVTEAAGPVSRPVPPG